MKTILMDINLLPKGFDKTISGVREYEKEFKIKVVPFDSSTRNTGGHYSSDMIQVIK